MKRIGVLLATVMVVIGAAASLSEDGYAERALPSSAMGRSYAVDGSELAYETIACSNITKCTARACDARCGGPGFGLCKTSTCCFCW